MRRERFVEQIDVKAPNRDTAAAVAIDQLRAEALSVIGARAETLIDYGQPSRDNLIRVFVTLEEAA